MKAIVEVQIIPIGAGVSVRKEVMRAHELLEESGLNITLHANGSNMEGELGEISVGAVADLAVWKLDGPVFAGVLDDPVEGWLRSGPTAAHHTIVAGRFVVRDGRLVSDREDEMLTLHRTVARRFQPG